MEYVYVIVSVVVLLVAPSTLLSVYLLLGLQRRVSEIEIRLLHIIKKLGVYS